MPKASPSRPIGLGTVRLQRQHRFELTHAEVELEQCIAAGPTHAGRHLVESGDALGLERSPRGSVRHIHSLVGKAPDTRQITSPECILYTNLLSPAQPYGRCADAPPSAATAEWKAALKKGSYTFSVLATDIAGNKATTVGAASLKVK